MNTVDLRIHKNAIGQSASKVVFIMLTATACVAFLLGTLPADQFMILAVAASSFYFSHKGTEREQYLGK